MDALVAPFDTVGSVESRSRAAGLEDTGEKREDCVMGDPWGLVIAEVYAPLDGAVDVPLTPGFSWQCTEQENGLPVFYRVRVSAPGGGNPYFDACATYSTSCVSSVVLQPGTQYDFHVWAYPDEFDLQFISDTDYHVFTTASDCVDDAYESGGSDDTDDTCWGGQIGVGATQTHLHCDVDWVSIFSIPDVTYRIETSNLIGGADTTLTVYEYCGTQVAYNDNYNGLASRIEWYSPSDGVVYDVKVAEVGNAYGSGKGYDLTLTIVNTEPHIFSDGFESGGIGNW